MWKRRKTFYIFLCLFVLIIYGLFGPRILPVEIDIKHRDMVEQHKCPACYGENLCNDLYQGRIKLTNWTKYTVSKLINARNVFHGVYQGNKNVIIKKLGHDKESEMLDHMICKLSEKSPYHCNPAHYIKFLTELYSKENDFMHREQNLGNSHTRYPIEISYTISPFFRIIRSFDEKPIPTVCIC